MAKSPEQVLTTQQNGQTIELKPGECFLLVLHNPGSGGYILQDPPEFDSRILVLRKTEKEPALGANKEGNFGKHMWTFQAKKEGRSSVVILASRPWEKEKAPTVIFEASVTVSK